MKYSVLLTVLFASMLTADFASSQQSSVQPGNAAVTPDLAVRMKALEDKLRSVGRLAWTQNTRVMTESGGFIVDRKEFWEQVTNVSADAKSCLLKVAWQNNQNQYDPLFQRGGQLADSYYLDEVGDVEVLPGDLFLHRFKHVFNTGSDFEEDPKPGFYAVAMDSGNGLAAFRFPSKDGAEQFAELLRESIKRCSETSVQQPESREGPGLAETLNFISEKLSAQGGMDARWSVTYPRDKSHTPSPRRFSVNYFRVTSSPATCSLGFDSVEGTPPQVYARLSLHHVAKIEVLPLKEYVSTAEIEVVYDHAVVDGVFRRERPQVVEASPTFVLKITSPGVEPKALFFSDDTLADRVAKAISHAAELCGAGAKPEPF